MNPVPKAAASADPVSLRILYADDMRELREVVDITLTREGHRIDCVSDGPTALVRLAANPDGFDLLITDHQMPVMDGIELIQKVRELKYAFRVMVFCSALSKEVQTTYRQLGVDRFLYKPVFPADLRQAIREMFPATDKP